LFVVNLITSAFAQSPKQDSTVSDYIKALTALWDKNKEGTFNEFLYNGTTPAQQTFTFYSAGQHTKNQLQYELLLKRNELQRQVYRKDVGLSLGGAYQENLAAPFASPEDAVVFRRKFQVGLEWDVLKGGFVENRTKIRSLENDLVFLKTGKKGTPGHQISTLQDFTKILEYFNTKKIKILEKRSALINQQNALAATLWEMKQITGDAYLKSIEHKTHINTQSRLYNGYNEDARKIKGNEQIELKPAIFDIDFGKIISYIDSLKLNNDSSVTASLPNPKLNAYYKDMSLKLYTRYNYYDVFNNTNVNRNFLSFGLNITAPLAFSTKQKNEIDAINNKLKYLQENNTESSTESSNTEYFLLNLFYEYRYKLNQYFTQLEKRKQFEELIRTENVKQKLYDLEFNPNTAIYILDDYWSNSIELLDLHHQLYRTLLNIYEKVPGLDLNSIIKPIDFYEYSGQLPLPSNSSIYIWSKTFSDHNETFISEYIKVNNYTDVLISFKNDPKYISQISELMKNYTSCNYHLMIGQNKVLNSGMNNLLDSLSKNISLERIKGIHLDVEPQAMDDFKENKDAYFKKYLTVFNEAKAFADKNKLELSVSIPLSFPENVLRSIFNSCNKVYLMAYENVNPEFISRKMEEEKNAGSTKIVLALRAKDFETRDEMEKLFTNSGIRNKAYHDLESMYQLDKKSIQIKENKERKEGDEK